MNGGERSWDEVKQRAFFGRPHVVILGAGASLAAFPEGDRFGSVLPLMNNLVDVLELTQVLEDHGLHGGGRNFEDVCSEIAVNPELADLQQLAKDRVSEYFSTLRLPNSPTIYDCLVLSLREKDYIATFNYHYRTIDSYFSLLLGAFPRRTCEAMWSQLMEVYFLEYRQVPRFDSSESCRPGRLR